MTGRPRVLILGGTTEGRRLASVLTASKRAEQLNAATSPTLELGGPSKPPGYDTSERPSTTPAPPPTGQLDAATSPTPELGGPSKPPGYDTSERPSTTPAPPPTGRTDRAPGSEQGSHDEPAYAVISSLAGRTTNPLEIAGDVRVGGFGGVDGLVEFLRSERIDAVVDATHPFAATMTRHAIEAAARTKLPVLVLRRPGWTAGQGDDWHRVRDLTEAAALVPRLGDRVFLTTGRQSVGAFAGLDDVWFLSRSVEPPVPPMPRRLDVVLDRGPFSLGGERRLLREHRIEVLVTKDSGGPAPKLAAARELGIPVVMVDRPPIPAATRVATVEQAAAWLETVAKR